MANAVEETELLVATESVLQEKTAASPEAAILDTKETETKPDSDSIANEGECVDTNVEAETIVDADANTIPDVDTNANKDTNVSVDIHENVDADAFADAKEDIKSNKEVEENAEIEIYEDNNEADNNTDKESNEDVDHNDERKTYNDVDANDDKELYDDGNAHVSLDADGDCDADGDIEVDQDTEDIEDEKIEKPLDDDQDRRNPQYIPKGGAFYEHDNRTSLEDVENKDPQEADKKKKSWKESKESERWLHDCYNESEQLPKSTAEILETYGYDIRKEDSPPRARRRRKYGRGPDKYERSWEDEQAYMIKQNNNSRRGKKKPFGREEFPPLPNQRYDSSTTKHNQKSMPSWKKDEEDSPKSRMSKINGNEKSSGVPSNRPEHAVHYNGLPSFHLNKKNYSYASRKMNDDDIQPFRTDRTDGDKWKSSFKQGKYDDVPKPIKTQSVRQSDPPFKKPAEPMKGSVKEADMSYITDGMSQMTFHNKQMNLKEIRSKANNGPDDKINDRDVDGSANRQKPKRYSKIRKGFTGIFPPEDVPELDQTELKLQEQKSQHMNLTQPLNMQNVLRQYAGTYSDFVPGNTSYLGGRPIISGIPQQGMSPQGLHQQTLSPQSIPQQALSPQVTGLQTLELQQNPLAQPNFVPQPMYIDMDPHYTSDVMGPFTSYPAFTGSQTRDVYQPSGGITYYSPECQNSGQKRPPPAPRQKAAIPIVRPSE